MNDLAKAPVVGAEGTSAELQKGLDWLNRFRNEKNRPLRVLHFGNIANNGFLNAKFLQRYGVDAVSVSADYYHVMATPEWEELDLRHGHGHDFDPKFHPADTNGYEPPDYFMNGSMDYCVRAIEWRKEGPLRRAELKLAAWYDETRRHARMLTRRGVARVLPGRVGDIAIFALLEPRAFIAKVGQKTGLKRVLRPGDAAETDRVEAGIAALFAEAFPDREPLKAEDVAMYLHRAGQFARMAAKFDVVQCYATDPILPLLAGIRPYVAFEHGTLRVFTQGNDPLSQLTALAYRNSDHTFITNGDCLEYAQAIDVPRFTPIPHPVDVAQHRMPLGDERDELRGGSDVELALFCPIRHDYDAKGTDIHLRAFRQLRAERPELKTKLVLVAWGAQVDESRAMLREWGLEDDVIWRSSLARIPMIKQIRAVDVVLDQMALPHFGGTAPQSLAAGTPVISSYVPSSTAWMFPERAPILAAFDEAQVVEAIRLATDAAWRSEFARSAEAWIDAYHSPEKIVAEHLRVYERALNPIPPAKN